MQKKSNNSNPRTTNPEKHFLKFAFEAKKFCHYDKAFTPVKDLAN